MNTNYVRQQIKEAMKYIESIDVTNFTNRNYKQRRINEAYSILFDLDNLLKMEEDE